MKGSFTDDPRLFDDLFDLLEVVYPGIRQGANDIRRFGASWESVSTPFVHYEGGRIVSHVGLIEHSLVMLGQVTPVGAVHAVATHPDHRRRGHYRRLMEELLRASEDRYETFMLLTERPEYYEPFGFRVVREHCFIAQCRSPECPGALRLLNMQDATDVALLKRLLETREAVSRVVGVVDDVAVFCFNECHRPLYYADELDVIVCLEMEGTRLRLFDVVGPQVPPLAALLERIPQPLEEVVIHFSPDRLAAETEAKPYILEHGGPSLLMVRGPFAPENSPLTLPRSGRT